MKLELNGYHRSAIYLGTMAGLLAWVLTVQPPNIVFYPVMVVAYGVGFWFSIKYRKKESDNSEDLKSSE